MEKKLKDRHEDSRSIQGEGLVEDGRPHNTQKWSRVGKVCLSGLRRSEGGEPDMQRGIAAPLSFLSPLRFCDLVATADVATAVVFGSRKEAENGPFSLLLLLPFSGLRVRLGDIWGYHRRAVRAEAASVIAQPLSGALAAVGRNECRWTRTQEGVAVPPSLRTYMTLTAHNAALAEVTGWYYSRLTRISASSNTIHTLHSPLALSLLQSACAVQYPRANEIRNSERPPPARNWVPSAQMRF